MSTKTAFSTCWAAVVAILAIAFSTISISSANAQSIYQTFDATVRLYKCSGSVITLPGAKDNDYALVMTSGHCIQPALDRYLEPGEIIMNRSLRDSDKAYFKAVNFYKGDQPQYQVGGKITDIVYATMDSTDLAILRVDKTYAQLRASDVKARPLATTPPSVGDAIQIPSGYWKKTYSCQIDKIVPELLEGSWAWRDGIRYALNGCQVQPGSSGSPIINPETGSIVGINTTYAGGGEYCVLNNPCEVNADGKKETFLYRGYGTQTYFVPACFNGSSLALDKNGCRLSKP